MGRITLNPLDKAKSGFAGKQPARELPGAVHQDDVLWIQRNTPKMTGKQ
jgi:hypothetical protein